MMLQALLLVSLAASAATPPPLPPKLDAKRTSVGSQALMRYSEDSRWMAAGNASFIVVWKVGETRPTASFEWETNPQTGALIPMAFSPNNKKLLVAKDTWGESLELAVADLESEKILSRHPKRPSRCGEPRAGSITRCEQFTQASFSPDGSKIAVRTQYYSKHSFHHEDSVLSAEGKTLRKTVTAHRQDENPDLGDIDSKGGRQSACVYAPDGALLATRADSASCAIIDCETGKRLSFLDGCSIESEKVPTLSVVGGKVHASGETRNWDARTGALLRTASGKTAPTAPYSFKERMRSTDGRFIALLAEDVREGRVAAQSLTLIDADTGKSLETKEFSLDHKESPYMINHVTSDGSTVMLRNSEHMSIVPFAPGESALGRAEAPTAPRIDVDAVPANLGKADPDAYAVVIGVEKYRQSGIPAVDYAARDAKTMHSYLTGAMGFDSKNVVLLTDDRASKTDLEKHLGTWLKNRVGPKSRVFVYYAGHGAPNPTTGAGYLMPFEADPSYLEDTAVSLAKMYASLDALPTKDVTVVLDACFSGQGPRSLIAKGARPLINVAFQKGPEHAAVISAAASNQISLSDPEVKHGLLTYYLLEGLHGAADADADGRITASEAFDYAKPAVERAARLQNQEQTPTASTSLKTYARPWLTLKK